MSSPQNQLSIYIRNCSHHNRDGRPNEIELRIVSTDVSSTTGEDRTRVIVSACESSSSCRESRTVVADTAPDITSSRRKCLCPSQPLTANRCAPFRRRVSFSNATVIGTDGDDDRCRATIMQDEDLTSACRDNDREIEKVKRETFYDIWQADDLSTGKSDDGYSESTPRTDNYAGDRCRVSGCTSNSNKGQSSQSENIGEQTIESDERTQGGWAGDVCPATDRLAENITRNDGDDTVWNKNLSSSIKSQRPKNVDNIGRDEHRMRGGCSGCYCEACENVWRSPQDSGCCSGLVPESNESCAPNLDRAKIGCVVPSHFCCRCPRVCKKAARCEPLPCTTDVRSCCGGGGCCGGCGKPSQICMPSPRICNSPAHSSRRRSPCTPRCPPQLPCSISGRRGCCSGSNNCGRSHNPKYLSTMDSGCCGVNDGTKCGTNGARCRLRLPCECLGGGLDCWRCGKKVYQAEMQIASGVPYHNICFSCFCCRKPLEPLTYQENNGEIYCKQCYVRNFGPQGYGYGMGAGVLQTSL